MSDPTIYPASSAWPFGWIAFGLVVGGAVGAILGFIVHGLVIGAAAGLLLRLLGASIGERP